MLNIRKDNEQQGIEASIVCIRGKQISTLVLEVEEDADEDGNARIICKGHTPNVNAELQLVEYKPEEVEVPADLGEEQRGDDEDEV